MTPPRLLPIPSRIAVVGLLLAGAVRCPAQGGLPFDLVDVADDPLAPDGCGIDFTWMDKEPLVNLEAAGVCLADTNDDGLLDVFFPNTNPAPNELYENQGGLQFLEVAAARGVADPASASSAALFLDYDHDGDLDLLVTSHLGNLFSTLGPRFKLFRNQGAAGGFAFSDVTAAAGFVLDPTPKSTTYGWASGVCAGDYDQDGWTDLFATWNASYISNQDQWRLLRNEANPAACDPLLPACTPRVFTDSTLGSGLTAEYGGEPWQPVFWDANRDGWPDLHIPQDFTLDLLMLNNKNGTFGDVATAVGLNGDPPDFRNEMGTALGDVDNDLDLDLHHTNIGQQDRLYRNDSVQAALAFTDVAPQSGLHDSYWGWGTSFFDVDNDGDLDHAAVQQAFTPAGAPDSNTFDLNQFPARLPDGISVAWTNVAAQLPEYVHLGPGGDAARGLAAGDLDADGDIDLVVTRVAGRASVYANTLASPNEWLQVDLREAGGSLDVTGARAWVRHHGVTQMRQVVSGSSYLCQEPARLHFGLGAPAWRGAVGAGTGAPAGASAAKGKLAGPTGPVAPAAAPGPGPMNPAWLVVRWTDGACQIVPQPPRNTILGVARSAVDDTGDLDADGHITAADQAMLLLATQDLALFEATYPRSPGRITGDVNDDGVLDAADLAAWALLPPH